MFKGEKKINSNQYATNGVENSKMKEIPYAPTISSLIYTQTCTKHYFHSWNVGKISKQSKIGSLGCS